MDPVSTSVSSAPVATPDGSVAAVLRAATADLEGAGIDTARLEAELLLGDACGWTRAMLWARLRDPVPATVRTRFAETVARRRRREPFQYIVGRQELWSLDFTVTPDVLIPRPETEILIDVTLSVLRARFATDRPLTFCDVGTGSGCIAIALARELPTATVWAVDASPAALRVAQRNAARFGVADRVRFVGSDLLTAVPRLRVDALVANPPYVRSGDLATAQPELAWEPRLALDGGASGLVTIERLVQTARDHVSPGGVFAVEIGAEQGDAVTELTRTAGWNGVRIVPDYAGRSRVLLAEA